MSTLQGLQKGVKGRRRLDSTRGQEACRVSTAIELLPGDLVSDSQAGVVMDLISGPPSRAQLDSLLARVADFHEGTIDEAKLAKDGALARVLPWVDDAGRPAEAGDGSGALVQDAEARKPGRRLCWPQRAGQEGVATDSGDCFEAGAAHDLRGPAG